MLQQQQPGNEELTTSCSSNKPGVIRPNSILCGDCVRVLPHLREGSVDFILTDPPYLVHYRDRDGRTVQNDDNDAWVKPAFREMYRVLKDNSFCVSFYGWNHADKFLAAWRRAGFRVVGHLTFPKQYASSEAGVVDYHHEQAYILAKGHPRRPTHRIPDVIPFPYTGNHHHATQKPLEILTPLIEAFSQPGSLVLDPMCGSASTCVAARLLDRRYVGIELHEQVYAQAVERLAAFEWPSDRSAVVLPFHAPARGTRTGVRPPATYMHERRGQRSAVRRTYRERSTYGGR